MAGRRRARGRTQSSVPRRPREHSDITSAVRKGKGQGRRPRGSGKEGCGKIAAKKRIITEYSGLPGLVCLSCTAEYQNREQEYSGIIRYSAVQARQT